MLTEELADRDALPFKVLADGLHVLLTLATRGTKEEHTADLVHLDLLEEEFEGFLRAGHDQLLKEVLKELIHLVLFQVLLNRLHVVELLHLVHDASL